MLRSLLTLILLLPAMALARDWQVVPAASTLGFQGSYQGEAFNGRFKSFEATIHYDPADLATAKFDVTVDLASADTASAERDEMLAGSDFFDVKKFPRARFVTESFAADAAGKVTAQGKLTIREHTRPVTLTVNFVPEGDKARLEVTTTLKRADFGLGTASDWDDIAADVAVSGKLELEAR